MYPIQAWHQLTAEGIAATTKPNINTNTSTRIMRPYAAVESERQLLHNPTPTPTPMMPTRGSDGELQHLLHPHTPSSAATYTDSRHTYTKVPSTSSRIGSTTHTASVHGSQSTYAVGSAASTHTLSHHPQPRQHQQHVTHVHAAHPSVQMQASNPNANPNANANPNSQARKHPRMHASKRPRTAAHFDGEFAPRTTLSVSDLNILHTTALKLAHPAAEGVETACKFFKEILLQDFPAEVFLQHPGILHSLVLLMNVGVVEMEGEAETAEMSAQEQQLGVVAGSSANTSHGSMRSGVGLPAAAAPAPAPSPARSNGCDVMAIGCLDALVAMLVHRQTALTKGTAFHSPEGAWELGGSITDPAAAGAGGGGGGGAGGPYMPAGGSAPHPAGEDEAIRVLDLCHALCIHLEPKLTDPTNTTVFGAALRLLNGLVLLLPPAAPAPVQGGGGIVSGSAATSAAALANWSYEQGVLRACLAFMSTVLVRHFGQQALSMLLINLLMVVIRTIERCVHPPDAAAVASGQLDQLVTEALSNEYLVAFRPAIRRVLLPMYGALPSLAANPP
jgi:hypothetical protein